MGIVSCGTSALTYSLDKKTTKSFKRFHTEGNSFMKIPEVNMGPLDVVLCFGCSSVEPPIRQKWFQEKKRRVCLCIITLWEALPGPGTCTTSEIRPGFHLKQKHKNHITTLPTSEVFLLTKPRDSAILCTYGQAGKAEMMVIWCTYSKPVLSATTWASEHCMGQHRGVPPLGTFACEDHWRLYCFLLFVEFFSRTFQCSAGGDLWSILCL